MSIRAIASEADWELAKAIRFEVFVHEQGVPAEEELDAEDAQARHWLALEGDTALGTARVILKGPIWKVGRVAVRREARGRGIGRELMRAIESAALEEVGVQALMLDSQLQARGFYEGLGYLAEGPEFMDAGIPHVRMRKGLREA